MKCETCGHADTKHGAPFSTDATCQVEGCLCFGFEAMSEAVAWRCSACGWHHHQGTICNTCGHDNGSELADQPSEGRSAPDAAANSDQGGPAPHPSLSDAFALREAHLQADMAEAIRIAFQGNLTRPTSEVRRFREGYRTAYRHCWERFNLAKALESGDVS